MARASSVTATVREGNFARLARRRIVLPLAILAVDLAAYGACALGAVEFQDITVKFAFAVLAGVFVSALAIIGHDAVHQSFTAARWLNRLIGMIAFLPALHPCGRWEHHHNRVHHRFTAQIGVDNAYPPMTVQDYRRASKLARLHYRFKRSLLGQGLFYLLDIWLPKMFLPGREDTRAFRRADWLELGLVYGWLVLYLAGLTALSMRRPGGDGSFTGALGNAALFGFLIPFLVWNLFISFVTIVQHTGPDVRWTMPSGRPSTPEEMLKGTVHLLLPDPVDWLFHRVMQHPAHHVNSGVPLYSLKAAQDETAARWPGVPIVARWTPAYHLRLIRECKLYDPARDGWCDFDFRPMGSSVEAEGLLR